MADHLRLAEGYRLVQMPPSGAPAHGPHPLRTLQPYPGSGPDSGLRPRGTPLGPPPPPPPPGTLAYGAFGSPTSFQHFPAMPPPAHLQPGTGTLYHPGRATAPPPGVPGAPPGLLQPPAGAPTPPAPALALGGMDAELIDEEALSSLELELGLHRVRELPELFLGQSEFDCFSDLGAAAPPAGSVSC